MAKSEKVESVRIGKGKLKKSDSSQIAYGESCISADHWNKCATKCKSESNMIKLLGVSDERTKKIVKEKSKDAITRSGKLHSV